MAAASSGRSAPLPRREVEFLYHHVFLPSKLPQSDDHDFELDLTLMKVCYESLATVKGLTPRVHQEKIQAATSMLESMQKIHANGSISEKELSKALTNTVEPGNPLSLHVRAQNAGVLVEKANSELHFHVFELSPTNQAAMSTVGRLQRSFPAASVAIKLEDFKQPDFQRVVAQTFARMSSDPVAGMQPKARKAFQLHDEDRDTTHPGMVTELMVGFLLSVGRPVASPAIMKNTREEVRWENTRSPWRRSPLWLLVRVSLQLILTHADGSRALYKEAVLVLMSCIEEFALKSALPSDALYVMNAKIAQRLLKLGDSLDKSVSAHIEQMTDATHKVIAKRWSAIQQKDSRRLDLTVLSKLEFEKDTLVSLPGLDKYVDAMKNQHPNDKTAKAIQSHRLMDFPADRLPCLSNVGYFRDEAYAMANLHGFESWVSSHCKAWTEGRTSASALNTTTELVVLMKEYHRLAKEHYVGNPEALSTMLLTLFDLWVACDEGVANVITLLHDYKTGINHDILQNLLLPSRHQMDRLHCLETYLQRRESQATYPPSKVFSDLTTPDCFPVRYFDSSLDQQQTLQSITDAAERARRLKVEELKKMRNQYKSLMDRYENSECDYYEELVDRVNDFKETKHSPGCARCPLKTQAQNLEIQSHEWPLPDDPNKAKAIVFELRAPHLFASWREATLYLITEVLGATCGSERTSRTQYLLSNDSQLKSFSQSRGGYRCGLLSAVKPHNVTHRKLKKIATASESDVCLHHGPNYRYFDSTKDCFLGGFTYGNDIVKAYTYRLPNRSSTLQKYLIRPSSAKDGPSPNLVIASQAECPEHMMLEEFKDLATLPFGHRIQWHNLLLQLCAPTVDFKKHETALIVFQCIYQAGPPSESDFSLRSAHAVLKDNEFAVKMLDSLLAALRRVKENWESALTLGVFATIIGRVLFLTNSTTLQQTCLQALKEIRDVAFGWMIRLRTRAQQAITQDVRTQLSSKSVEAALVCATTFDIDDTLLVDLLCSAKTVSTLIQCSIAVQEGKRIYTSSAEPVFFLLHSRFRRVLRRTCHLLCAAPAGLDDAIQNAWPAYQAADGWTGMRGSETHWIQTKTSMLGNSGALEVHYNVLTGELLVNGLPLDRAPRDYENHPSWAVFFGKSAIEVMPTTVPGMQFSLKQKFQGHEVHVNIHRSTKSTDLAVLARKAGNTYTLVPRRFFTGQFPEAFVQKYVHWHNQRDGSIEFRSADDPWTQSAATTWTLKKSHGSSWQLSNQDSTVIKLQSSTSATLANILSPLAEPSRIHVILTPSRDSIQVNIPKLQVGFSLTSGECSLQSLEFRNMWVDENQSLGTLHGFSSKLLLKARHFGPRMVLLAEGPISVASAGEHVSVTVDKGRINKVHPLTIDDLLGRLVDTGNIQCKLFQCYLHGLTSFCLPDLLTGKTGIEQSLSILNSAAVRSFDQLSKENVKILNSIASLTPRRCYYPANEQVMQTVSFSSNISFLSQHNSLAEAVKAVYIQAKESSVLYEKVVDLPDPLEKTDETLLERDCIRSSTFSTSDFGAEGFTSLKDKQYRARDSKQDSSRTLNAHVLASIVYRNRQAKHWEMRRSGLWADAENAGTVLGSTDEHILSTFKFHSRLIADGLSFSQWLSLHKILQANNGSRPSKFDLMIWLATLAASEKVSLSTLQTIALMYTTPAVSNVSIPKIGACSPEHGCEIRKSDLNSLATTNALNLSQSPEANLRSSRGEYWRTFRRRRDNLFMNHRKQSIDLVSDRVSRQWPARQASTPDFSGEAAKPNDYINVTALMSSVNAKFSSCYDNLQLKNYLTRIEEIVSSLPTQSVATATPTARAVYAPSRCKRFVTVRDIFDLPAPVLTGNTARLDKPLNKQAESTQSQRLNSLIAALETSCTSSFESEYIDELRTSIESLQRGYDLQPTDVETTISAESLLTYRVACLEHMNSMFDQIMAHVRQVADRIPGAKASQTARQWPRISPACLLQLLSRKHWLELRQDQKECVVQYGLAIAELQRADRLVKAANASSREDLIKEIATSGHQNWSPLQFPESLLLEIESGIFIRDVQEEIAAEMRTPSKSGNSVMQLNMGEGKSSVIVPMVAAALADSSQLVRVVVAKPQSKQMLQMLVSKLGGLVDRRVRQMPFSRSLKLDAMGAKTVDRFLRDCMSRGDIILIQPEHILSFRLMVLECSISEHKGSVGRALLDSQGFLDQYSRDIVDESDENFSTKFELIYTMGTQRQIEFGSSRWQCIQQVLELVRRVAPDIKRQLPDCVELHYSPGGEFSRFRILKSEAAELLVGLIADHLCEVGIDGLPIARQPKPVRDAIRRYLVELDLSEDAIQNVEDSDPGSLWQSSSVRSYLLLLRGLLAAGILAFAFGQKRWRVNYGLVSTRIPATQLAVPYRAKDNPTPRSEFSHPDVVLVLTCLSYYYEGLSNNDLFTALEQLIRSDQADVEYEMWIKDIPDMPPSFRQLEGINIKDTLQCIAEVFPYLKKNKAVIDYFLAKTVFPRQVKEFPDKLSASGWDIGMVKALPTTGFSGTNDSKQLLPLDVQHLDLSRQQHTNALVLTNILDPKNSVHLLTGTAEAALSDAEQLITAIVQQDPPVDVILDVGAQILELNDEEVAQRFLQLHRKCVMQVENQKQAVVFVNDADELLVLDSTGRVEPLQTSSYSSRLDECLVFLDEAHTRGIDLKLPRHYRAAVTLGANLTKDRLAQACMRMRKLGQGQTVVFCINAEIEGKIRTSSPKLPQQPLEVSDVLRWTVSETFTETKRNMPLWKVQGERHLGQKALWNDIASSGMSQGRASKFLEPESQSLEDRYRPQSSSDDATEVMASIGRATEIRERLSKFEHLQYNASVLQEEQERELAPEIEQETQIERPRMAKSAVPQLHPDLQHLISSGLIKTNSPAYMPAFQSLQDTTAAFGFALSQLDGDNHLLVTADFRRTIQTAAGSSSKCDSYQRGVQWVLATQSPGPINLMIISPFEAQQLLPSIKASSKVALHLYKPRCSVNSRTFDRLDFLSIPTDVKAGNIPRRLLLKLDVFAGQLYLNSYEDYLEICAMLGLATEAAKEGQVIAADGFILRDGGKARPGSSPVKFLSELMCNIRRNGQGISKTDMGYILEGKLLERSHFEGRVSNSK